MLDTKAIAAALAPIMKEHTASAVSAATAPLIARIKALETREPMKGLDGADGQDGRDGTDAPPVSDDQISAAVERYLAGNPPAAGADGRDGKDGADGQPGAKGEDGRDGADGVGLAGAVIDRAGELNVTLTNGQVRNLGPVVGRDGRDGVNGDRGDAGFSLTDFDTDWRPEEKVLVLRWDAGETSYSHELFVPYVRDMGVWGEGKSYLKGDGVTWAGSFWIAQDDTTDKPDVGKGWRLAVKRGRDGKDFAGPAAQAKIPVKI